MMKSVIYLIILIIITFFSVRGKRQVFPLQPSTDKTTMENRVNTIKNTEVIAGGLDTPWGMVLMPDGKILITERKGSVKIYNPEDKSVGLISTIALATETGEGGLLGITLHPDFEFNHYVYFYYTYAQNGNNTLNRVVRMTFSNNGLSDETIIVNAIPGSSNHNGGRIKFGPDGFLYVGTGDAGNPSSAQDTSSFAGKILKVGEVGNAAPGNPFNNEVYSFGHRNVQGIAWDINGDLYATEHGRSGVQSGLDEINKIESGKNYGWPVIQGDESQTDMVQPLLHSGNATWAPSGMAILNGSLYFTGLKGQTLYQLGITDASFSIINEFLKNKFGRLREVITGDNNSLLISTSNLDGRGKPGENGDLIIKVSF